MKASTVFKFLISVAALLVVGFLLFSRSVPIAIVTETERGMAVNAVPGTINVLAEKEMFIKGEHGGRVINSNLEKGGTVTAGEVLIVLDTGDIDLEIEKAENELSRAQRNLEIQSPLELSLETHKDALEDVQFRFNNGGVREMDLRKYQRAVEKAEDDIAREKLTNEETLQNLENAIKRLKRQKEKMTIISPIDGIVTEVHAHEGDLIGGGYQVAKVVSQTRIVEMKVSEEHFVGIGPGMPAQVSFLGIELEQFDAKVAKIIPVADPTTQRFTVHLEVDIERERLDPGLTGDAVITLNEHEDALLIPRQAVVRNDVLVVKDGIVSRKEIQIGYTSVTMIEVLNGLSDGDQVIVENLHLFDDGDRVKVAPKS
jgi:RND family efflux transporter MFP subunit